MKIELRCEGTRKVVLIGWAALGVAVGLVGCGGTSGPQLSHVSGTVTQDGEPLAGADVMFVPEQGAPSSGKTDAGGRFELKFADGRPGAVPGKHMVLVTIPGTELPEPTGEEVMPAVIKPPVEFRQEAQVSEAGENNLAIEVGT